MNKYIISEKELIDLLARSLKLQQLEEIELDRQKTKEFLLDCINERIPKEEIPSNIDYEYVATLDLKYYEKF